MIRKQKKIDTIAESDIATGMIVNDRYLKEILPFFQFHLLKINYIKTVVSWCIDYYKQYNTSPKATIQEIFDTKIRQGFDETEGKLIATFLETIANNYDEENYNVKYMLDQAEEYFRKRALEALASEIILTENIQEAEALISNFKRPTRMETKGINAFTDAKAIKRAFDEKEEFLFKLPGAWGEMIGPLKRGDFLAVFGPGKRGKSFTLTEIAIIAAKSKLKTLFLSLEMTQPQVMRRIHCHILEETKRPMTIEIPKLDCLLNQLNQCPLNIRTGKNICSVENNVPPDHVTCTACKRNFRPLIYYIEERKEGVTHKKAVLNGRALQEEIETGQLKLECRPGKSINMLEFKALLDNLEHYEKFIPDVIVTDYADFFKPMPGTKETRHQINEIWETHRSIAQERNCIVVTASHTPKHTYTEKITQSDQSEDSRKLNHVTKAFALNQEPIEKKKKIMRISLLAQREEDFNTEDEVVILQQLEMAKFHLDSYKKPYKEKKKKKEK